MSGYGISVVDTRHRPPIDVLFTCFIRIENKNPRIIDTILAHRD
jgi:hypothetical protein